MEVAKKKNPSIKISGIAACQHIVCSVEKLIMPQLLLAHFSQAIKLLLVTLVMTLAYRFQHAQSCEMFSLLDEPFMDGCSKK